MNKFWDKSTKTKVEDLTNLQCETCARLGRMSQQTGDTLVLLTLSPDPYWKQYNEQLPFIQYNLLQSVLHDKGILKSMTKQFGYYRILSAHYEFNKMGNLHAHALAAIHKNWETPNSLVTISKVYHKVIGQPYNRCSIAADTRFVICDLIYKYLNKENIYPPLHSLDMLRSLEGIVKESD